MLALQAIVSLVIQLLCVPSLLPPAVVLAMRVIMILAASFVWLVMLHVSLAPHQRPCAPHVTAIQEGISLAVDIVVYVVLDTST
jgi:hypothetical protein